MHRRQPRVGILSDLVVGPHDSGVAGNSVERVTPDGAVALYVQVSGTNLHSGAYDWSTGDYFAADYAGGL